MTETTMEKVARLKALRLQKAAAEAAALTHIANATQKAVDEEGARAAEMVEKAIAAKCSVPDLLNVAAHLVSNMQKQQQLTKIRKQINKHARG